MTIKPLCMPVILGSHCGHCLQSEAALMKGIIPEKHERKVFDMIIVSALDSMVKEGEVSAMVKIFQFYPRLYAASVESELWIIMEISHPCIWTLYPVHAFIKLNVHIL